MIRRFKTVMGGLVPAFPEDREWLEKKPLGTLIEAPFKEPRNAKLHRKWWSLCGYLAEHSERFPTSEHASKWLLIRLGYCTWIKAPTWKPAGDFHPDLARYASQVTEFPIADSISFAKMGDEEFSKLYDRACDLLCEMLPHIKNDEVRQVLAEFAGVGWMEHEVTR